MALVSCTAQVWFRVCWSMQAVLQVLNSTYPALHTCCQHAASTSHCVHKVPFTVHSCQIATAVIANQRHIRIIENEVTISAGAYTTNQTVCHYRPQVAMTCLLFASHSLHHCGSTGQARTLQRGHLTWDCSDPGSNLG